MKIMSGIAVAMLTLALAGCGGGDEKPSPSTESSVATTPPETTAAAGGNYCALLAQTQEELGSLDPTTLDDSAYADFRAKLTDLEMAATGEVSADWKTLGVALDQVKDALDQANVTFSDIPILAQGQVPNGADVDKLPQVREELQTLATDSSVAEASTRLQADASAECDIDLGATPTEPTAS